MMKENYAEQIGQNVVLEGRVYKIREMSGFAFVLLQTRGALLQCVHGEFSEFPLSLLCEGAWVRLRGTVVAEARSKSGFDIHLQSCEVLSRPYAPTPVPINGKSLDVSLATLLDLRSLTLRNERERAIFKVQAGLCQAFRVFFHENGFTEIHTPKIVASGAEGGANIFGLDYFGRQAYLCQSPQFYKQAMVGVFERVYEIAPVFRAEKHDTSRHVNEYTSVDLEMGFITDFHELMLTETDLLRHAFASIEAEYADELSLLGARVPRIERIPEIRFDEAKELVSKTFHRPVTDEADFDPEEEKLLCELIHRQTGSELVFVTHYRSSKRPFYTMDTPGDPQVTQSFDLLFRGLEITTGGQRIHEYERQIKKLNARGMDPAAFESWLQAHKYGLPPHGGLGLGLERLTARLLGFDNLRRATLYPRDINRLEP